MRLASTVSRWFASRSHRAAMNRRMQAMNPMPPLEAFEPRLMLSSSPGPQAGQGGPVIMDDHGNDFLTSTFVALPSATPGELEEPVDQDWFSFFARSQFTYTIDVSLGTLTDSTVELVESSTGESLAFNDDFVGLESHLEYTAESGGHLSAIVRSYGESYTGTYTISITETAPPDDHGDVYTSATPVSVPSQTDGTLENSADLDWFQFDLVAGTTYRIQTVLDGHRYDLNDSVIFLYGVDGVTQAGANDDYAISGGLYSRLNFTAVDTGTHYLYVTGFDGQFGSYIFAIEELPDDHGDLPALATPLALGVQATGRFETNVDEDVFSFLGVPGGIYNLTGFASDTYYTNIVLTDGFGDPLAYTYFDDVTPYTYAFQAPADGLVYFHAFAYFVDFAPDNMFGLTIEESGIIDDHANDASNASEIIPVPGSLAGDIQFVNDSDWFYFFAIGGQEYTLATVLDTLFDSTLALYDQDGITELAYNDDYYGYESRIVWTAPVDGFYFLAVRGYDEEESGTYDLVISHGGDDHGNDANAATGINVPDFVGGDIQYSDDVDWFSFYAFAGENLTIRTVLGTLGDSILFLYDQDGQTQLDFNDDYFDYESQIDWIVPADGYYYVAVAGYDEVELGTYDLIIEFTEVPPPDLVASYMEVLSPDPFLPSANVDLRFDLYNFGPVLASNFTVSIYISQDGFIDPFNDWLVRDYVFLDVVPSLDFSAPQFVTIQLPDLLSGFWNGSGQYALGLIVNSYFDVVESDYNNNSNTGLGYDSIVIDVNFLRGDFNGDGQVDLTDITLYQTYTRNANPWSSLFELAGDPGTLDQADLNELIRNILLTEYGDADLNRQVSLGDLVLVAENFNGPGGWGQGDFTGDGMVTLGDLVILAENYGFSGPQVELIGVSLVALESQGQADEEDGASAGLDVSDILDEIAASLRD